MKKNIILIIVSALFSFTNMEAQQAAKVTYNAFVDCFYAFDINRPQTKQREDFLVNYNRHNRIRLNHLSGMVNYEKPRFKAKAALQAGTFVVDNYANERSKYLGVIQEANVAFAIDSAKNWWIEVGVLPSHIGYESAIAADNWALTRSLSSELTPYYLSGAKLTYKKNKITFSSLLINSWTHVLDWKKNQLPSFGTQLIYRKKPQTTWTWNTFVGSATREGFSNLRIYNNIFCTWEANKKDAIVAGLDLGYQKKASPSTDYQNWFALSLVYRRKINDDWYVATRGELFFDEFGSVTKPVNNHAFDLLAASMNVDYQFIDNGWLRLEGRLFSSSGNYFDKKNGSFTSSSNFVTLSINKRF